MNITVRFFARAKDLAGTESIVLQMPDRSTVGDVRQLLAQQYPRLQNLLAHVAWAVRQEMAHESDVLQPNDEVAVLPPVSGGSVVQRE